MRFPSTLFGHLIGESQTVVVNGIKGCCCNTLFLSLLCLVTTFYTYPEHTPVWLEKPERIATLAMLTVMGLLVYALIQRQVRLYLRDHNQYLPGNKGATAIPTAAVVLSLFVQVMMVQLEVDTQVSFQVYGLQDYHLMVCDALGIDRLWYASPVTGQNTRMSATPP